jgi:hypothetical protein
MVGSERFHLDSLRQGFDGSLDQLAEYLARARLHLGSYSHHKGTLHIMRDCLGLECYYGAVD